MKRLACFLKSSLDCDGSSFLGFWIVFGYVLIHEQLDVVHGELKFQPMLVRPESILIGRVEIAANRAKLMNGVCAENELNDRHS